VLVLVFNSLEILIHLCYLLFYLKNVQECLVFYDPFLSGHCAKICREHGQWALEHAHIYVLNYGSIGSEVLKNLVLGIINTFIIDDAPKVYAFDLSNNYFDMLLFLYIFSFAWLCSKYIHCKMFEAWHIEILRIESFQ
jgi:hypothetical protein